MIDVTLIVVVVGDGVALGLSVVLVSGDCAFGDSFWSLHLDSFGDSHWDLDVVSNGEDRSLKRNLRPML